MTVVSAEATFETLFSSNLERINDALARYLTSPEKHPIQGPEILWDALRYSTLSGGKRIRPLLTLESGLACNGNPESILPTACAIELVHAQSLIHDDLPCMDNDDLRRGKPTLHKAFDESTAVLSGDALLAMAFGLISHHTPLAAPLTADILLKVITDFSNVASVRGLVNGQFVDIHYEGKPYTPQVLEYIHTYKTGALFTFSTRSGAQLAGAPPEVVELFTELGQKLGLAFQIVDDLLDISSTSEALGKTPGKDLVQEKATFPALYGEAASSEKVEVLAREANELLDRLSQRSKTDSSVKIVPEHLERLRFLIEFICHRIH